MKEQDQPIVNRVAQSSLVTINLEDYYHTGERIVWDMKEQLFQGLILKEKDFRKFVKEHDWSEYQDKNVAIICSVDAIVPTWAFMLVAVAMRPYAHHFVFGDLEALEQSLFQQALSKLPLEDYRDAKVVIKGCGNYPVPEYAYVEITRRLSGIVSSLMYGEPCSTVPLYKRRPKS